MPTSSDGQVTVTADPPYAGARVTVQLFGDNPPVLSLGAATAGGTFAAGTYYWKISAVGPGSETVASNQVQATLTVNQEQGINWLAVTAATGYKVWRGTVSGQENTLVATLGAVTSYIDTGSAGTAGSPSGRGAPQRVTVTRTNPDGTTAVVRGGDTAPAPGGIWYGIDHEAPLAGSVSYTAAGVWWDGTTTASTAAAAVTLAAAGAWMKSLAFPSRSVQVSVPVAPELNRLARSTVVPVVGYPYPTTVSDLRSAQTGRLTVRTPDAATRTALLKLLADGQVILFQADANHGLDDMYLMVGDVQETRPGDLPGYGLRMWICTFTEVARPTTTGSKVAVPARTYADIPPGQTYAQDTTAHPTYLSRVTP